MYCEKYAIINTLFNQKFHLHVENGEIEEDDVSDTHLHGRVSQVEPLDGCQGETAHVLSHRPNSEVQIEPN